ncbi:MAG: vWA domain-containing protein [Candidatus Micrarchaeota archaeon]
MGLKKLLLAIAVCLFLLVFSATASQIKTERECNSDKACNSYEECFDRHCIALNGYCNYGFECDSGRCNETLHVCNAKRTGGEHLELMFIIDASWNQSQGNVLEEAKKGAIDAVDVFPDGVRLSIGKLGGCAWGSCGSCGVLDFTSLTSNKGSAKSSLHYLYGPNDYGGYLFGTSTALEYGLKMSYLFFQKKAEQNASVSHYLIIFSDGIDTCGGDSCETAQEYALLNKTVPTYVVGYIADESNRSKLGREQLQCIANVSGGKYYEANSEAGISGAFLETVGDIKTRYIVSVIAGKLYSFQEEILDIIKELNQTCMFDSQCSGKSVCLSNKCTPSVLHIVFVPVNWRSGMIGYNEEVDEQAEFLIDTLPSLANCTDKIKITKLTESCEFEINPEGSEEDLKSIERCAMRAFGLNETKVGLDKTQYNFVVGMGEHHIFSNGTIGYSIHQGTVFISRGYEVVTAHELGHEFGLRDEYCDCSWRCGRDAQPNPLKEEYGCNPEGDCCYNDGEGAICGVITGKECNPYPNCYRCCKGNNNTLGGRAIMGFADAQEPRYHDEPSLKHLETVLRCPE